MSLVLKFCFLALFVFSELLLRSNGYTRVENQELGAIHCLGDDGTSYPVGEKWYNKKCEILQCQPSKDGRLIIRIYGCRHREVPEGCQLMNGEEGATYPKCCPKVMCEYSDDKWRNYFPVYVETECFDDDFNSHPIGGKWYDNKNCERLECVSHDDILYARGYGCPSIGVPSDCQLIPGKGVEYPNCCPQVECEDGVIW